MKQYFLNIICILLTSNPNVSFGNESSCDEIIKNEIPGFDRNNLTTLPKEYSYNKNGKENMPQEDTYPAPRKEGEYYSAALLKENNTEKANVTKIWNTEAGSSETNPLFTLYYSADGRLKGFRANTKHKPQEKEEDKEDKNRNQKYRQIYYSKFYTFDDNDDECKISRVSWLKDRFIFFSTDEKACKAYEAGPYSNKSIFIIPFYLACMDAGGDSAGTSTCTCRSSGFPLKGDPYLSACPMKTFERKQTLWGPNPLKEEWDDNGKRTNFGDSFVKTECKVFKGSGNTSSNNKSTPTKTSETVR